MARVHVKGILPFPYLITQLGLRAEVPCEPTNEKPTAADYKKIILTAGSFRLWPDTPSEPSKKEAGDYEEEARAEAEQAGPEQAVPYHEEPNQIQPADPEIPLQEEPPLQQTDPPPPPPTLIQIADPQTTTKTPTAHPSGDDTSSDPA
nr:bromodomain-containing protein 4-like [Arachis hypogaea]